MIRKWLHRRWASQGSPLWRTMGRHHESWMDRSNARHVAKYGEHDEGPWHVALWGRFVCWLSDWQTTWRMRP